MFRPETPAARGRFSRRTRIAVVVVFTVAGTGLCIGLLAAHLRWAVLLEMAAIFLMSAARLRDYRMGLTVFGATAVALTIAAIGVFLTE